jgi:MFS family permease
MPAMPMPTLRETPPARSYRATVGALAVGQLVCWAALYYTFSSLVLPMQAELGWSKPAMMGAFTLGLACWGGASYAAGAAIDRGHGRAVMSGGAALAGLGFLLWSQVATIEWLYLAWALMGIAMAMTLYEPAFSVLTRRFPEHFRDAITTLTLVGGFASTLSFPAVAWLLTQFGWRAALVTIGFVLLLVIAPLHAWALRGPPSPTVRGAGVPMALTAADATLHDALRERAFWLLTLCFTLHAFVAAALWAHIMPALASKGRSETQSLAVVVWFGPAQVVGRFVYLLCQRWGLRIGVRALGLAVLAMVPLSMALFALVDGTVGLLWFALLFGIANGLITIVRGSLVPEYFGRAQVGRIGGAMAGIALLSRASAPLVAAWALIGLQGYRGMLLGLAALGSLAWLAFMLTGAPRRKV